MGDANTTDNHPRKKRKYSRNGCKECKRRKLKCDEGKPACFNCDHLSKICVYEKPVKFCESRQFTVDNSNFVMAKSDPTLMTRSETSEPKGPSKLSDTVGAGQKVSQAVGARKESINPTSLDRNFENFQVRGIKSPILQIGSSSNSDVAYIPDSDELFMMNEASLLINDLNNLVTFNLSDIPLENVQNSSDSDNFAVDELVNDMLESENNYIQEAKFDAFLSRHTMANKPRNEIIQENVFDTFHSPLLRKRDFSDPLTVIESFHLANPHSEYLNLFVSDLSRDLFPFAPSLRDNAVMDILLEHAKKAPYLLASLLSIAATFQFNKFKLAKHQKARSKYLSVCLKILGEIFSDQTKIMLNIESLLLTVLILTSDYSATKGNSWRTHLRGAKDLLLRFSAVNDNQSIAVTPGLALARSWFAAIEILAGLTSPTGGTIRSEIELNAMLDVCIYGSDSETLQKVGLLSSNGFNLFLGYASECVVLFRELVKSLEILRVLKSRSNDDSPIQIDDDSVVLLIALVHAAKEFQVVDKSGFINRTHPTHPDYIGSNKYSLPPSAYGFKVLPNGVKQVYSWFDISHHIHVDAAYLKILLTPGLMSLPRDHPMVNRLVKKIIGYLFFIVEDNSNDGENQPKFKITAQFDIRCVMIQWPMRLCGILADDNDFEKVEVYFDGLSKLGNGSSQIALDKIKKSRKYNDIDGFDDLESVPFS